MFRTSNPAMRNDVFGRPETWDDFNSRQGGAAALPAEAAGSAAGARAKAAARPGAMTLQGTINKSFMLLALCMITAVVGWHLTVPFQDGVNVGPRVNPILVTMGGAIVGLILAMVTVFKPRASPITAPAYALAEGFFVGGVSAIYASWFARSGAEAGGLVPDYTIVLQAALGTFGTFGAMLVAYTTRIIKPTQRFRTGVIVATGGVMFLYIASMVLRLVGIEMPFLHAASPIGIAISVAIIGIAALNLILDFDYIETGVKNGAPKWGEWYGGFALLVTLVWLYIEFLRLIAKIRAMADR